MKMRYEITGFVTERNGHPRQVKHVVRAFNQHMASDRFLAAYRKQNARIARVRLMSREGVDHASV